MRATARRVNISGMIQTASKPQARDEIPSFRKLFLHAYRIMLLARAADDKVANLYRAGKIHGGVFLSRGQEALSVSLGLALKPGDVFAPLIRDTAGRLAFNESLLDLMRTYLGSSLGPMRGRDGNIHRGRPKEGQLAMISHLGAMISVVNGILFARRLKGITGTVGATCIGDGGTSTGAFHEALNQAAVEKLPLVLIIADNQYAYSTPTSRQFACKSLVNRATGYGLVAQSVDGTDLDDCLQALGDAVAKARAGHGPQVIVAHLLRLCGHGEHDPAEYIDPALKNSPLGRDCLKVAEEKILQQRMADAAEIAAWRAHAAKQMEEVWLKVQHEPSPDPFEEKWCALSETHLGEGGECP